MTQKYIKLSLILEKSLIENKLNLFSNKNSMINVIFFHGFMSDMTGKKPRAIQNYCQKKKINFLKFEYSGHGKSDGDFIKGNITKWTKEAKKLINS